MDKREQNIMNIIIATINCISDDGIAGATVRNITSRAGVNTAAINYYFGSRENLIEAALKETLRNAFDTDDIPRSLEDDYRTVFSATLSHWYDGVVQYPGITRAHFDEIVNHRSGSDTISAGFRKFILDIYDILIKHGLKESPETLARVNMIFASFMFGVLFPEIARPAEKKEDFIRLLVEML